MEAYQSGKLQIRWFSYDGVNVLEGRGKNANHGKAIFIDGHISIIGSYNFTTQSTIHSAELSILIDDPVIYEKIKFIVFDRDWVKSISFELDYN